MMTIPFVIELIGLLLFTGDMAQEPTLEEAMAEWPVMEQQVTFIGVKDCPTKFQIYWNGAISCFIGWNCFGELFPTQVGLNEKYEKDQLHLTFGYGKEPTFEIIDKFQVSQSLLKGYLPITETSWRDDDYEYNLKTVASPLQPDYDQEVPEQTVSVSKIIIKPLNGRAGKNVDIWLNLSGYKCLIWEKEKPTDSFPPYSRQLTLKDNTIYDDQGNIRLIVNAPDGAEFSFYKEYNKNIPDIDMAKNKGLLKNLLHVTLPVDKHQQAMMEVVLPYFPVSPENREWLKRDYETEERKSIALWDKRYENEAQIITPEKKINDLYTSRSSSYLHHLGSRFKNSQDLCEIKSRPVRDYMGEPCGCGSDCP